MRMQTLDGFLRIHRKSRCLPHIFDRIGTVILLLISASLVVTSAEANMAETAEIRPGESRRRQRRWPLMAVSRLRMRCGGLIAKKGAALFAGGSWQIWEIKSEQCRRLSSPGMGERSGGNDSSSGGGGYGCSAGCCFRLKWERGAPVRRLEKRGFGDRLVSPTTSWSI